MSDTYQAIYDAVRSRVSDANTGRIIGETAREMFDLTSIRQAADEMFSHISAELLRPSVIHRPALFRHDGPEGAWCAMYGEDESDVCVYGPTPDATLRAFDAAWIVP